MSTPQVIEFLVRESFSECLEGVFDIDHQALLLASVLRSAQPAPNHLNVGIGTERRTRDVQCADAWGIETLGQEIAVSQHLNVSIAEGLNSASALAYRSVAAKRVGLDVADAEER